MKRRSILTRNMRVRTQNNRYVRKEYGPESIRGNNEKEEYEKDK